MFNIIVRRTIPNREVDIRCCKCVKETLSPSIWAWRRKFLQSSVTSLLIRNLNCNWNWKFESDLQDQLHYLTPLLESTNSLFRTYFIFLNPTSWSKLTCLKYAINLWDILRGMVTIMHWKTTDDCQEVRMKTGQILKQL